MVGDDVVVHVMEIVGNTVRIGIEAPRCMPVYREEIWHAVREENRAAADAAPVEPSHRRVAADQRSRFARQLSPGTLRGRRTAAAAFLC